MEKDEALVENWNDTATLHRRLPNSTKSNTNNHTFTSRSTTKRYSLMDYVTMVVDDDPNVYPLIVPPVTGCGGTSL